MEHYNYIIRLWRNTLHFSTLHALAHVFLLLCIIHTSTLLCSNGSYIASGKTLLSQIFQSSSQPFEETLRETRIAWLLFNNIQLCFMSFNFSASFLYGWCGAARRYHVHVNCKHKWENMWIINITAWVLAHIICVQCASSNK